MDVVCLQSESNLAEFLGSVYTRSKIFPAWVVVSLTANGMLLLAVILLLNREHWLMLANSQESEPTTLEITPPDISTSLMSQLPAPNPNLGRRHQLSYQQWVALLGREAEVAAAQQPKHLTILAGDSLSLWFPNELLPTDRSWLNQGISGETSAGLLNRLELFDQTRPTTIFVMIGINDLIRGVRDETILANQRLIIRYLRRVHPPSQIVVQSILPHSGEQATWTGRDRLLTISNSRIQEINRRLAIIARQEGVNYLDLYPLFADDKGYLRPQLTTDGLHLNMEGYLVWRSALQLFSQLELEDGD